ncbi:MAG TPA: alanine racemase C-terminal domain-containing protein, partial [Paraburkholderia sp.]
DHVDVGRPEEAFEQQDRSRPAELAQLRGFFEVQQPETIGYGSIYTARKPTRIGVVACGYADGYPRVAPEGTPVMVDGVHTRIVGRVSMDMVTVDLTPCPGAGVGARVELWGPNLPIDDVARACGTVGYELMCAVAQRVPVRAE